LAYLPIDRIDAKLIETTKFMRPVVIRNRKLKDPDSGKVVRSGTLESTGNWVPCSTTYTQQAQRTLRVMLGKAEEWKTLPTRVSFAIGATPQRVGLITPEIETVTLRELSKLRTRRPWLVVITLQDTGARPAEVFAIRLENVDWAGRRIWIPEGKTKAAKRWIGMSERMHKELSTWCHGSEGPGWLFPARTSGTKTGHLNSINKSFRAACISGGLDTKLVPYLSRHSFGTVAMRETGNTFAVMKAMGHSSVQSMKPYQHQETDQLTAVINQRNSVAAQF
jgi:integrase